MKSLSRLIIVSLYCIVLGEPLLASQALVRKDTEFDEIGDVYKKVCLSQGSSGSEALETAPFSFESAASPVSPTAATELLLSAVDIGLSGSMNALFIRGKEYLVGTETIPQDLDKAVQCFERVAAYGHADALYELGILYVQGKGVDKNFDKALEYLTEAAQLGHKQSYGQLHAIGFRFSTGTEVTQDYNKAVRCYQQALQGEIVETYYNLGLLYFNGQGVDRCLCRALDLFTQAAQLGFNPAYELIDKIGVSFATGKGVAQNYKKAVSCFEQAMQGKVPEAYNNLGWRYYHGQGVDKNLDKALELFQQAAQFGCKQAYGAIRSIGFCFTIGRGVRQDYKKAVSYYEQAMQGKDPDAYYNLSLLYLNGQGVKKNIDKGLELLMQAAQLGCKQAYGSINYIGVCFVTGKGVTQDYKKAISCFEQAIQGKVPEAYKNLGLMYYDGQGVEKNLDKSLELLNQAAQLGHTQVYEKICRIGLCFANGTGVAQDYKKAVSCFNQAIQGNVPMGFYSLGVLHLNDGQGVEKNPEEALKLFTQAARLGYTQSYEGIRYVGACFAYGGGVMQDYKKAASCYQQAIQGGILGACRDLGCLYFNGNGVDKNLDKALELFTRAANLDLGFQDACIDVYHCFAQGIRVQKDEKKAAVYLKKIAQTLGEREAKRRADEQMNKFLSDDPKINCVGEDMPACPICTDKFTRGDAITVLVCSTQALHIFCKGCLDRWRATCQKKRNPLSCPCCRSSNAPAFEGHAF